MSSFSVPGAGIEINVYALSDEEISFAGTTLPRNPNTFTIKKSDQIDLTEVKLVEVPVVVRDGKRRTIAGLKQNDFQVFDSGKEQPITSFSVESGPAGTASEDSAPAQLRLTLYAFAGLLVSLLAVTTLMPMDRVVASSAGQIVTAEPTIVLQALDPSIIKTLDVQEGQLVKRGQLLATLDPTFYADPSICSKCHSNITAE